MTAFHAILDRIYEASMEMVRKGFAPTEVWLGPAEMKVVEEEMSDQCARNWIRRGEAKISGLAIREAAEDGIWVRES